MRLLPGGGMQIGLTRRGAALFRARSDWRTALPHLGLTLEGMRELQHAEIVAMATDDLQADRQAVGREAGRHGDRRMAGDSDVVAALHPVEIVAQPGAGNFARPLYIDRVGRELVDRADEEVVPVEESAHAVEELRAQLRGARHLFGLEAQTLLDVPLHRVLQVIAPRAIKLAVGLQEA